MKKELMILARFSLEALVPVIQIKLECAPLIGPYAKS